MSSKQWARLMLDDESYAGSVKDFSSAPKVVADPDRRSLKRNEWMNEFFTTSSSPVGHGFNLINAKNGFASYSFVPKSTIPIKVIVLDDTQREDDGSVDIHGHGFLDQARYDWLKKELDNGQAAGQLMIIAAHIPIAVEKPGSELGWWNDDRNAVSQTDLINELQKHPNFIMWIAGHRHLNTVKAFSGTTPENSFWQVETSSLRDFPQQFRTFEIYLNSDNTISIVTTDVDPAVKDGTPATKSRSYAVAAQQIINNDIYTEVIAKVRNLPFDKLRVNGLRLKSLTFSVRGELVEPQKNTFAIGSTVNPNGDPSIKPMPTGSYNAELVKHLSPEMQDKMKNTGTPIRK